MFLAGCFSGPGVVELLHGVLEFQEVLVQVADEGGLVVDDGGLVAVDLGGVENELVDGLLKVVEDALRGRHAVVQVGEVVDAGLGAVRGVDDPRRSGGAGRRAPVRVAGGEGVVVQEVTQVRRLGRLGEHEFQRGLGDVVDSGLVGSLRGLVRRRRVRRNPLGRGEEALGDRRRLLARHLVQLNMFW